MAEKKKRKPLKDINKDGKTNFGDTWLGDALGFDGKLGVQGPSMKKSLKGARRGKDTAPEESKRPRSRPKKEDKPTSRSSTGGPARYRSTESSKGGPARYSGSKSSTGGPARYGTQSKPNKMQEEMVVAATPAEKTKNAFTEQRKARAESIQKSAAERANRPSEREIQAWIKEKMMNRAWAKKHQTGPSRREAALKALSGMAAGGMTSKMGRYSKTGNTNYKGKGMFYDSKSPRGYK